MACKTRKTHGETLAQQHRRLVPVPEHGSDNEWLEQPDPVLDSAAVRFVTTYGTCDKPV